MKTRVNHRLSGKNGARRISAEARKLIQTTIRRCKGSERAAAKALRLVNHAQLGRMLRGEMGETPAMRAALIRAKARAQRAYYLEPLAVPQVELEQVRKVVGEVKWIVEVLEKLLE